MAENAACYANSGIEAATPWLFRKRNKIGIVPAHWHHQFRSGASRPPQSPRVAAPVPSMGLAKTGARGHGQGLLTMGGGGVTSIEEEHSDRSSDMGGTRRGWLAAIAQASRADGFWLAVVLALLVPLALHW